MCFGLQDRKSTSTITSTMKTRSKCGCVYVCVLCVFVCVVCMYAHVKWTTVIAAAQCLRNWVSSMEVPSLNADKIFWHFHPHSYPAVTVLLGYIDPVIYSCLFFAL